MAEREVRFLGPGSGPGTYRIDDGLGGNPSAGNTSMVPAPQTGGVQVKLPNGSIITVGSMAEAEVLRLVVQQQRQQNYVDLSGGGGGGGGWNVGVMAEAGTAAAELVNGLHNSKLVKKAKEARAEYKDVRDKLIMWWTNPATLPKDAAGNPDYNIIFRAMAQLVLAQEAAEQAQDDICSSLASMAYFRAAGGALKAYNQAEGGNQSVGNMFGGAGTVGGIALGVGGTLLVSKLLED